jgi:hypothetical protein
MTYFLSSREGQLFGSFHYPYAIVEHSLSHDANAAVEKGLVKKQSAEIPEDFEDVEVSIDVAYQASSFIHETRHFYDQFGTFAGLSLFSNFIEMLKNFYAAAVRIKVDGHRWHWPDGKWVAQKVSPAEVRRLIRNARAFRQGSELLLGAFAPVEIDGHIDDVMTEAVTTNGLTVDVAPIRIFAGPHSGSLVAKTILYPLGMEVLFEANAHAITRNFVEGAFSKKVADSLKQDHLAIEYNDGERPDLARQILPYMVLDLQISKYLQEHSKEKFSRNTVFGVADEVLSLLNLQIEHTSDVDTRIEVPRVGKLIEDVLARTPVDDLVAGNVPANDLVTQIYRTLLQSFEQGGDWETVKDDRSLLSSIRIWESYVAQHFAVPLLRRRLATGHQVFRSSAGMLELIEELSPPTVASDGRLKVDLPDRVGLSWAQVLMAGQLTQSIAVRDTVLCPRAFATVPGLSNASFSRKYNCDDYVSIGCGKFDGVTIENTPCMFVDLLRDVGFIK